MGGTVNDQQVVIRGHGIGNVHRRDGGVLTIDCRSRLLPGRRYIVQGAGGSDAPCRMRVVSAAVRCLLGESGVGYRVTFQAEPPSGTTGPALPAKLTETRVATTRRLRVPW